MKSFYQLVTEANEPTSWIKEKLGYSLLYRTAIICKQIQSDLYKLPNDFSDFINAWNNFTNLIKEVKYDIGEKWRNHVLKLSDGKVTPDRLEEPDYLKTSIHENKVDYLNRIIFGIGAERKIMGTLGYRSIDQFQFKLPAMRNSTLRQKAGDYNKGPYFEEDVSMLIRYLQEDHDMETKKAGDKLLISWMKIREAWNDILEKINSAVPPPASKEYQAFNRHSIFDDPEQNVLRPSDKTREKNQR